MMRGGSMTRDKTLTAVLRRLPTLAVDNPQPSLRFFRGAVSVAHTVLAVERGKPYLREKRGDYVFWESGVRLFSPGPDALLGSMAVASWGESPAVVLQHRYELLLNAFLVESRRSEYLKLAQALERCRGSLYNQCRNHTPDDLFHDQQDNRAWRHDCTAEDMLETVLSLYRDMTTYDFIVGETSLWDDENGWFEPFPPHPQRAAE